MSAFLVKATNKMPYWASILLPYVGPSILLLEFFLFLIFFNKSFTKIIFYFKN